MPVVKSVKQNDLPPSLITTDGVNAGFAGAKTCPAPLQRFHHYYGTIRPCALYQVLFLFRVSPLNTKTTGSHVPYISLHSSRAISIPVAAGSVIGYLPYLSRESPRSPVLTTSNGFSIPHQWFTCVRLLSTHLTF